MKKSLKTILSFIVIIMLTVSAFAFNVSAASATVSGAGEYEVGKSFSVTVNFNADATLYAVEATVNYNSSVLRLDSVSGADYNVGNGSVKIVDDGFSATKPSKSSSYTLKFTAVAAGNSPISASILGGGEAESRASASAAVSVVTPKPSSNANLASIKLSAGSLSPAFNANTTNYSATVKYNVDSITVTGAVADGGATYVGGGTFALNVGDNSRVLTVTAADGTKKTYTVNIKRMSEEETAQAEQAARDANPLLVVIDGADYTIANSFDGIWVPAGFTQGTALRKDTEIAVLNDDNGEYQLYWLVDASGANGAFYTRDENDNFTKINYINANGKMYIIEELEIPEILPDGYVVSKYDISGNEVDTIVYEAEELKDFCILRCYADGARDYYRYDSVQGTMQRAAEFDLAVANALSTQEEEPTGLFEQFKTMNKTGKIMLLTIAVMAVLIIVVAVLLIVKIARRNRYDGFEANAGMQSADDEFILNDFAQDIKYDEQINAQEADSKSQTEDSSL